MLQIKQPKVPALCKAKGFTSDEFTQADLQFLKAIIEDQLDSLSTAINVRKGVLAMLWNDCNPDDPNTQEDFNLFSKGRTQHIKAKAKKAKLEAIQRKIKKQLSNPV